MADRGPCVVWTMRINTISIISIHYYFITACATLTSGREKARKREREKERKKGSQKLKRGRERVGMRRKVQQ